MIAFLITCLIVLGVLYLVEEMDYNSGINKFGKYKLFEKYHYNTNKKYYFAKVCVFKLFWVFPIYRKYITHEIDNIDSLTLWESKEKLISSLENSYERERKNIPIEKYKTKRIN